MESSQLTPSQLTIVTLQTHLNRSENGKPYRTNWSRIMYSPKGIINVKNFLKTKDQFKQKYTILLEIFLSVIPFLAYIGPGMGGGVIAAIFGIIAAFFIGLWGILYYPIKRAFKNKKKKRMLSENAKQKGK